MYTQVHTQVAAEYGSNGEAPATTDVPHTHEIFERKAPARPSGIKICGVTSPPARNLPSNLTPMITKDEVEQVCKDVIGTPLFDEHRVGEVLGRVTSAWPDQQGRVVVEVEMEDTVAGWSAIQQARQGERVGFSWGGVRYVVPTGDERVETFEGKQWFELSLTNNPEFSDDALIHEITENSALQNTVKEAICRLVKEDDIDHRLTAGPRMIGK